jgi:hypothetical protein
MKIGWAALALCACGDSSRAPVAPIVVADQPVASSSAPPPPATATATVPAEPVATAEPEPTTPPDVDNGARDAGSASASSAGGLGRIGATSSGGTGSGGTPGGVGGTSPTLRQGVVTVTGKLPPEVVQRIVRQNYGRFRLCYENGLRTTPKLGGKVIVKFNIRNTGDVAKATDGGSDLPDKDVVACVVKRFSNLSFPQPESGEVAVVYPIIFAPPGK